ncbi:MAG: multiheme c-type cytochrome [Thermogutta sp.]
MPAHNLIPIAFVGDDGRRGEGSASPYRFGMLLLAWAVLGLNLAGCAKPDGTGEGAAARDRGQAAAVEPVPSAPPRETETGAAATPQGPASPWINPPPRGEGLAVPPSKADVAGPGDPMVGPPGVMPDAPLAGPGLAGDTAAIPPVPSPFAEPPGPVNPATAPLEAGNTTDSETDSGAEVPASSSDAMIRNDGLPGNVAPTAPAATPAATVTEGLPNPLRHGMSPVSPSPIAPSGTAGEATPSSAVAAAPGLPPGPTVSPARIETSGKGDERRLERPPFDPIAENGEFFVGWSKPELAIVITGRQDGYFEPCGCAGKDRMKGGLSRRHTMIRQLREQGWPVVAMDIGGFIKGFGKQTEIKFQMILDALKQIDYDAVNLGKNDLRLPATLLLSLIATGDDQASRFVSANTALFAFDADQWTARRIILERGGVRVGITSVLGKDYYDEIHNNDIAFKNPEEALAEIVPELERQADWRILLAYAKEDEVLNLARRFPQFQVVVSSDGPAEPPGSPQFVPGTRTMLVHVGEKGMAAVVLGIFNDPRNPIAYQRVILDSRYPDSPEMKQVMVNYQSQLEALGLDGLEIRAVPHPRRDVQGEFVGSEKCANCHEKSYDIWRKSGHAKAWETLVRLDPPRTSDPECISCHVTGWHPTRYFPYESGFLSQDRTPKLIDVGCESCHGPGGEHVSAEMGSDVARQQRAAQAMIVTKEEAETSEAHSCRNCHDLDNSPDFDFAKYWPLVEHYEKE